ncbi:MAG: hypothetical protein AAGA18_07825 [Verrucomicrobiota bacterium]
MQACEVWSDLTPQLNHEILESAYLKNKKLYRSALDELSKQLRKRVVTIQQMPRKERHLLFQPLLGLPQLHMISQNLLMSWLGRDKIDMLSVFLDELGIEHDGAGCASSFPDSMDKKKIKAAVDKIYQDFDAAAVTLYLKTFDSLTHMQWDGVEEMIRETKHLSDKAEETDRDAKQTLETKA